MTYNVPFASLPGTIHTIVTGDFHLRHVLVLGNLAMEGFKQVAYVLLILACCLLERSQ
jgi:hypothetical protein